MVEAIAPPYTYIFGFETVDSTNHRLKIFGKYCVCTKLVQTSFLVIIFITLQHNSSLHSVYILLGNINNLEII
jgi:hypothetical protein